MQVLDGIRGLAVLIVLASHTSAFGMHGQGSLGVLLFFFLSGYVLTIPYARNPARLFSKKELFRFSINRILRIVPIYIVAVLFIAWLADVNFNWILAHITFYKGWNHLWSVAQEARFYLLFPFVVAIWAFLPNSILRILATLILIYLSYLFRNEIKIDMLDGRFVSFYFWYFLGGMLACMLYFSKGMARFAHNSLVKNTLVIASIFILYFVLFSSDHMIYTFWRPIFNDLPTEFKLNGWRIPHVWFFLFLLLLYTLTTYSESKPARFIQWYFFRHIGLLSYSLYLFHMPVFLQLRQFGFKNEGMFFAVLGISYVFAVLSYLLVEKPFLSLKIKR